MEAIRLVIELEFDSDPIAGRIVHPAGNATCFSGWLGLAAALSEAGRGGGSKEPDEAGRTA